MSVYIINLQRVSKKTGLPINDVDGHYVILAEIAGRTEAYGKIIDPSKNDIVIAGTRGAVLTDMENVYWLPLRCLEEIWHDVNIDLSPNSHWAMVLLSPKSDPAILAEYRN